MVLPSIETRGAAFRRILVFFAFSWSDDTTAGFHSGVIQCRGSGSGLRGAAQSGIAHPSPQAKGEPPLLKRVRHPTPLLPRLRHTTNGADELSGQTLNRKRDASLSLALPRAGHFLFARNLAAGRIQERKPPDAMIRGARFRQSSWMKVDWRLAAAFPENPPCVRSKLITHRAGHCAPAKRACHGGIPIERKRAQTGIPPQQDRARNSGLGSYDQLRK